MFFKILYYRYIDNKPCFHRAMNHAMASALCNIFYQLFGFPFWYLLPTGVVILYKTICYLNTKRLARRIDWLDYAFDAFEWHLGGLGFGLLFYLFF